MDLADLTSAAGTIRLGGKTYLANKLRVHDVGQIRVFIKDKALDRVQDPFVVVKDFLDKLHPGDVPEEPVLALGEEKCDFAVRQSSYARELRLWKRRFEEYEKQREFLLTRAMDQKGVRDGVIPPDLQREIMTSVEGTGFLVYLMLRQNHPDLSIDHVTDLVRNEDITSLQGRLDRLMELPQEMAEETGPFEKSPEKAPDTKLIGPASSSPSSKMSTVSLTKSSN